VFTPVPPPESIGEGTFRISLAIELTLSFAKRMPGRG